MKGRNRKNDYLKVDKTKRLENSVIDYDSSCSIFDD